MRTVNMALFIIAVGLICWAGYGFEESPQGGEVAEFSAKPVLSMGNAIPSKPSPINTKIIWLPDPSNRVFVGPQLSEHEFTQLINRHPEIKTVIRLNTERGGLSIDNERSHLESLGIDFISANIEGKNDQLNEGLLQQLDGTVDAGGVYIHCKHGQHRAKVLAGRYLARQGYRRGTVYDLMNWWAVVKNQKYQRYVANVRLYHQKIQ